MTNVMANGGFEIDVEYGPDGEPYDPNKDYSEFEPTELAWTHDAVIRFCEVSNEHDLTAAQMATLRETLQTLCQELGEDFVEDAYVAETAQDVMNPKH